MAPDPHSEDKVTSGHIISGHKISLNVLYDEADTNLVKLQGHVTPTEEEIARSGAIFSPACQLVEKVTFSDAFTTAEHVDEPSMDPSMQEEFHDAPSSQNTPKKTEYRKGPEQIIPSTELKAWEPHQAVRIKTGSKGPSAFAPLSVPGLLKSSAEKYPNCNALAVKTNGKWEYVTYTQYHKDVRTVAKAFIKLGLQQFGGVCILGFNSKEWFYSNLGAIFAGGLSAGIYTTNSPEACAHCASDCKANIWVVEDQKQLDKVLKVKGDLPHLKTIIQYKGQPTDKGVLSWQELMDIGEKESDFALEQRLKEIAINQCCTLIYTSGTTGSPKGVMLSHDNLTWTCQVNMTNLGLLPRIESLVSYLPLSHVAAQMADIYICMNSGGTIYFAQPDALKGSLGETLKEAQPTVFLGVPRVWEKIYEKMMEVGRKTTGVKKSIATWAKAIGLETSSRRQRNDYTKPFGYSIANNLVFKNVKFALGLNKTKIFISAAAPISLDIIKYFHSLEIPLTEIYGMSESSAPHTAGLTNSYKYGSTGKTVPGSYTKIDNPDADGNGEICMGGRNVFMGYLNMKTKTEEAIDDDGFLYTGDVGSVDMDGFLFITGRIKEIIITAGGENIAPTIIEEELKRNLPCVSNAMLIGDRRKFLSILLTLKTNLDSEGHPLDSLTPGCIEWCQSIGSDSKTLSEIISKVDENVMRAIQTGINETNANSISNAQRIQKWTLLPTDFSVPGEELGPTMKLKRPIVNEKYKETIEKFYN